MAMRDRPILPKVGDIQITEDMVVAGVRTLSSESWEDPYEQVVIEVLQASLEAYQKSRTASRGSAQAGE